MRPFQSSESSRFFGDFNVASDAQDEDPRASDDQRDSSKLSGSSSDKLMYSSFCILVTSFPGMSGKPWPSEKLAEEPALPAGADLSLRESLGSPSKPSPLLQSLEALRTASEVDNGSSSVGTNGRFNNATLLVDSICQEGMPLQRIE